jgi:L-alanine-DL-glutamate epimerase-like enolase superfamily enzyme
VAVPLERPIRLGQLEIREREYVVLRLRDSDGLEGAAIGYTRGLPVAEALAGVGVDHPGAQVRALSLIEIARWDLEAKRAALPLWRLLGGTDPLVPILAVGGYFLDQRPLEDVEDELRALVAAGFKHVKVHAHEPAVVERLRRAVGDEAAFSIDLHMRFRELEDALRECRPLDDLGLGFIEDPFPPERPDLTAALADRLETPVAAGVDACGRNALLALARAADVLRVDATSSGGIRVAVAASEEAAALGHPAMTHAFVELHAQVAGGTPAISTAETIPYASGANPFDRLLASTQRIEDGMLALSEEPGHGLVFDWDAVGRYTRSSYVT